VSAGRLRTLTIPARVPGKIDIGALWIVTESWDISRNMGNGSSRLYRVPVVMRQNLSAVTSDAYGEYSYNYAAE